MAMTGIEKRFVNRQKKAQGNIRKIEARLAQVNLEHIQDVLEIGCGIGAVSAHLSQAHGMNVVGSDFDPEQVQIARSLYPGGERLTFQVEDGANLSFGDSSFDLVVSQNVFHHVPDWQKAIQEVARVLKPGGYFIWYDLTFPRWMKTIFQPLVKNYGLYTFSEVQAEFERNRLKIIEYQPHIHLFVHHDMLMQLTA